MQRLELLSFWYFNQSVSVYTLAEYAVRIIWHDTRQGSVLSPIYTLHPRGIVWYN